MKPIRTRIGSISLSLLLSLCLLLGLLSPALAAEHTAAVPTYDISGAVNSSSLPAGARIRLTGDTVLTLNANCAVADISNLDYDLTVYGPTTYTLKAGSATGEDGIAVKNLILAGGRVEVNGYCYASETIHVSAGVHTVDNGIYGLEATDVLITGGIVEATGVECGAHIHDRLTVSGTGKLTASASMTGGAPNTGVFCAGAAEIHGGTVIASGADYGLWAGERVYVAGGTLQATASLAADANSTGLYSAGRILIQAGTVEARGSDIGIRAEIQVRVSGGQVTAGAPGQTRMFGIYTSEETTLYPLVGLVCTGGRVEAHGAISALRSVRKIALTAPCMVTVPAVSKIELIGPFAWTVTDGHGTPYDTVVVTGGGESHACLAAPFDDVDLTLWYHEGIDYMLDSGYMQGIASAPSLLFAPEMQTTRAMVVTILHRMQGTPSAPAAGFGDVSSTAWYAAGVNWAAKNNIVLGYTDNTFRPNDPITREQFAAILYRYAGYDGKDTTAQASLAGYTDRGSVAPYAREAIAWAVAKGLIRGMTETTLVPQGTCIRAQVATIFHRYSKIPHG